MEEVEKGREAAKAGWGQTSFLTCERKDAIQGHSHTRAEPRVSGWEPRAASRALSGTSLGTPLAMTPRSALGPCTPAVTQLQTENTFPLPQTRIRLFPVRAPPQPSAPGRDRRPSEVLSLRTGVTAGAQSSGRCRTCRNLAARPVLALSWNGRPCLEVGAGRRRPLSQTGAWKQPRPTCDGLPQGVSGKIQSRALKWEDAAAL